MPCPSLIDLLQQIRSRIGRYVLGFKDIEWAFAHTVLGARS